MIKLCYPQRLRDFSISKDLANHQLYFKFSGLGDQDFDDFNNSKYNCNAASLLLSTLFDPFSISGFLQNSSEEVVYKFLHYYFLQKNLYINCAYHKDNLRVM